MMRLFFKDKPTTKLSIDAMVEDIKLRNPPMADQIVKMLLNAKDFLSVTDSSFQKNRDIYTDIIFEKIFHDAGVKLASFQNSGTSNNDIKAAFEFCVQTYSNRIEELKANNDKMYLYYSQHDNPLKDILASETIKNTLS